MNCVSNLLDAMRDSPTFEIIADGIDIFFVVDGVKIAKREHPGTAQAKWISLEPGWSVLDGSLTIAEAAAEWGVSTADIRKSITSGETESVKDEHGELCVATIIVEHNGVRVH
jgi:hypothetical protein